MEKDITIRISELMDLFDEGEVTTADKIDRPQSSLDREMFQDANIRFNKAGGGMLVQPSADGSRPGYAKDTRTYEQKYAASEKKYTGSAKPPKKKKWQGVFGKEKADEIYNEYVKFYTDAYNNKNMSQVSEATTYFKEVYGKDGEKAYDLLRRNGYTDLKSEPYKLKQKLLTELIEDAQGKLKYTNKFDIIDKVFTEAAAKYSRTKGLSSLFTGDRQRLAWFGEDLFNKINNLDKIDDKISKALDYMVENNIEIKDVKKVTGSVFNQGVPAGEKSRLSPIKKTIVSLVDNGKDGISRDLLNKGLKKNAWYQSQTVNGKNLFDYVAREYGREFVGEGFLDAYESGKSRFGRVTVKGASKMPLPESLIFQFGARSADRNFKAGTYKNSPVKITDLKGNEIDFGSLPVNEKGQRIVDPSKHKFTYNGTLYGKDNLIKLGKKTGDFTEVYEIAADFKSYKDTLVPNPKNPSGKKIPFSQLMDMSGIDLFMAIGHDDSKGGVKLKPFNNFQIQNKFVNKSLDSAYRQVKNKDLRKRIADDIYGDLKGLRGEAYKDAWIRNNTKLLNDIILNRNIPPSLYRQAGENIIKSDVFQTFSKKKQAEVIRVSGLNKTQLNNLLSELASEIDPDGCGRKIGATGGRVGLKFGSTACATKAKNYLGQVVDRGIQNEPPARVGLIKKIISGTGNFIKQGLSPSEMFKLENLVGKPALYATAVIESGLVADDVLRKKEPINVAAAENFLFGNLLNLDADAERAKNIINDPNLSPAAKTYAQGIIDQDNYRKLSQTYSTNLIKNPLFISSGAKAKADTTLENLKNKILNTPETGRMDYESLLADKQDAFTAKEKPFDAPDKPGLPSFTSGQLEKRNVPGEFVIDPSFPLPLQKEILVPSYVSPSYSPERPKFETDEFINEYLKSIGEEPLRPGEGTLFRMSMPQLGLFGANEKFAGGGIAGLSGGIDKGPQTTSMNPDSQGLQGLMKRGMKG